jgi:hypothetical protein
VNRPEKLLRYVRITRVKAVSSELYGTFPPRGGPSGVPRGLRRRESPSIREPPSDICLMSSSTMYGIFRTYANTAGLPRERQHLARAPSVDRGPSRERGIAFGRRAWLAVPPGYCSAQVYAVPTNQRREAKFEQPFRSGAIAGMMHLMLYRLTLDGVPPSACR